MRGHAAKLKVVQVCVLFNLLKSWDGRRFFGNFLADGARKLVSKMLARKTAGKHSQAQRFSK